MRPFPDARPCRTSQNRIEMNAAIGFVTVLAHDGWGDHMDWDDGWWLVMMIGMVIFWALVVLGIVWLVREMSGHRGLGGHRESDPLELLDRRLAEGTVSPDDYRERRAILTGSEAGDGR
jgi:putative membrane protein